MRTAMTSQADRAASLLASDPVAAEQEALHLLNISPNDPRGHLILGSALRRQGHSKAARAVLEPLAKAYPRAANTQYELGATLIELGEPQAAARALSQAVEANPDLAEAWRLLGDLLFTEGDAAGAEHAYLGHDRATVRDPRLKPMANALFQGRAEDAEEKLRTFLIAQPNHAEGLRMLGELCAKQGRHADAQVLLGHALELDPSTARIRFSYSTALFRQQKAALALIHAERLLHEAPDDPAYRNLAAACLGLLGENDRVLEMYEALAAQYPKQPGIWLNFGHALRTAGRREEAVCAYRTCLTLAPGHGEAYWSLANLKVVSFSGQEEAAMEAAIGRSELSDDDRLHLHYALGKALEDRRDYKRSFHHYAEGARIRRAQTAYDADETTAFTQRSKVLFTPAFFAARAGGGSPSNAPIFIVGLPRAGSTLIEQILASHSQVEGTMELPEMGLLARSLCGAGDRLNARYPEVLSALNETERRELGEAYLADTKIYRRSDCSRFIDKMPNNFQHIGLIRLILPHAKIIDARRSPFGSCFSAFKQHFNQGQTFSYDLTDVALYYRDYIDLMNQFDEACPGAIHPVIYEDLVENTETEIRRLLDYCDLPFEENCLHFYTNDRAVRTVSSEQVRRPIFRDGLHQWRHYEAFLAPVSAALGEALENWRGR